MYHSFVHHDESEPKQLLIEAVKKSKDTSQLYANIVQNQRTRVSRWAIVGPGFLPNDVTTLALSYAIGTEGMLYSIDPQQNDEYNSGGVFSVGGSELLKKQLDELRENGIPLSNFVWLGKNSHFGKIPEPAQNLDGIADHCGIEFIFAANIGDNSYIINGLKAQFEALRRGGVYVYQSEKPESLTAVFKMPFQEWLSRQGLTVITHTLDADVVRVPVSDQVLVWLEKHKDEANGYGREARQFYRFVQDGELVFKSGDSNAVWYPSPHVFVAVKQ